MRPQQPRANDADPRAQGARGDVPEDLSLDPAQSNEDRMVVLTDLARRVTARHDLGDVLAVTFAGLRSLMRFEGGSIQLIDDEGWIRMVAADPTPSGDVLGQRIPLGDTIGGRVILTERAIYLPDVLAEPAVNSEMAHQRLGGLDNRVSPGGVRSYFGVPLIADGRAIGLLQIDSPQPNAWADSDRLLLASLAPIVAAAIQNARAHTRVAILTASRRRELERHALVARILEDDVDGALAALVALSEDVPLVRDQIDELTVAVGRIRAALGDRLTTDENAPTRLPTRNSRAKNPIDLRTDDKLRT